jgi:hypothetical protein
VGVLIINSEKDIIDLIRSDEWMMEILRAAKTLQLPDWWICAGFVRSKIWDVLHGFSKRTPLSDVDLIYFDAANKDEAFEKQIEHKLSQAYAQYPLVSKKSIKNA